MQPEDKMMIVLALIEDEQDGPTKGRLATVSRKLLEETLSGFKIPRAPVKPRRTPTLYRGLTREEIFALEARQKLQAVKLYRGRTGCTLLESKKAVEAWMLQEWGYAHYPQP